MDRCFPGSSNSAWGSPNCTSCTVSGIHQRPDPSVPLNAPTSVCVQAGSYSAKDGATACDPCPAGASVLVVPATQRVGSQVSTTECESWSPAPQAATAPTAEGHRSRSSSSLVQLARTATHLARLALQLVRRATPTLSTRWRVPTQLQPAPLALMLFAKMGCGGPAPGVTPQPERGTNATCAKVVARASMKRHRQGAYGI